MVVAVLAATMGAAAAAKPVPRGTMTSAEYHEFLAVQKAARHAPNSRNPVFIAAAECKALTNLSRVTSTQHAECEADYIFFVHLVSYTPAIARCTRAGSGLAAISCFLKATGKVERATENFFRTDAASRRAATARGFTGKCLDYLVLTSRQSRAMHRFASAARAFALAISAANGPALKRLGPRLTVALEATIKTFTGGSVSVCPHQ